jgi:hypothetical protein
MILSVFLLDASFRMSLAFSQIFLYLHWISYSSCQSISSGSSCMFHLSPFIFPNLSKGLINKHFWNKRFLVYLLGEIRKKSLEIFLHRSKIYLYISPIKILVSSTSYLTAFEQNLTVFPTYLSIIIAYLPSVGQKISPHQPLEIIPQRGNWKGQNEGR